MKLFPFILFVFSIHLMQAQVFLSEKMVKDAINIDATEPSINDRDYNQNFQYSWYELDGRTIRRIGTFTYNVGNENMEGEEYEEYILFNTSTGLIQESRSKTEWCKYYASGHLRERMVFSEKGLLRYRIGWLEKNAKESVTYSRFVLAYYENGKLIDCQGKGCKNSNIEKNKFIIDLK